MKGGGGVFVHPVLVRMMLMTRLSPLTLTFYIIGNKHVFSCINNSQVPRDMLKTESKARDFQPLLRDLMANFNALKNNV